MIAYAGFRPGVNQVVNMDFNQPMVRHVYRYITRCL